MGTTAVVNRGSGGGCGSEGGINVSNSIKEVNVYGFLMNNIILMLITP